MTVSQFILLHGIRALKGKTVNGEVITIGEPTMCVFEGIKEEDRGYIREGNYAFLTNNGRFVFRDTVLD